MDDVLTIEFSITVNTSLIFEGINCCTCQILQLVSARTLVEASNAAQAAVLGSFYAGRQAAAVAGDGGRGERLLGDREPLPPMTVFLSYSHADWERVEPIVKAFEFWQWTVFTDLSAWKGDPNDQAFERVRTAIDNPWTDASGWALARDTEAMKTIRFAKPARSVSSD